MQLGWELNDSASKARLESIAKLDKDDDAWDLF
jgi:hypothetical protein